MTDHTHPAKQPLSTTDSGQSHISILDLPACTDVGSMYHSLMMSPNILTSSFYVQVLFLHSHLNLFVPSFFINASQGHIFPKYIFLFMGPWRHLGPGAAAPVAPSIFTPVTVHEALHCFWPFLYLSVILSKRDQSPSCDWWIMLPRRFRENPELYWLLQLNHFFLLDLSFYLCLLRRVVRLKCICWLSDSVSTHQGLGSNPGCIRKGFG